MPLGPIVGCAAAFLTADVSSGDGRLPPLEFAPAAVDCMDRFSRGLGGEGVGPVSVRVTQEEVMGVFYTFDMDGDGTAVQVVPRLTPLGFCA